MFDRHDMEPTSAPVELEGSDAVVTSWESDGRGRWMLKVYTVDGSQNMRPLWFDESTLESAQAALNEMLHGR